jgi:HlyD family secretion protein
MRKFFKNRIVVVITILAVLGVAAFFVVRSQQDPTATQYQTTTVERGNLTATIGATGTVRAKQSAVLVWQAAGTVESTNIKAGDQVQANDVLASLSKASLPQSIILAEADLASAQKSLDELTISNTAEAEAVIALRDAKTAFTKAENWHKQVFSGGKIHMKKIVYKTIGTQTFPVLKEYRALPDEGTKKKAQEDFDLAQARLDDAQRKYDDLKNGNTAEIIAAQARVDAAQATINLARILAPFDATVTESYPLPGDQVAAGTTAFRLDNLSELYVDVEVSEVDINSVAEGQSVTLTFDAILNKEYHGEVVEVAQAGTVTNGVVNFKVTVELTDSDPEVRPGMTAAVNIVVEEMKDVVLVPNRAVRLVDGERVIYLLVNGEAVKKEIRLGSSSDTMSVVAVGDVKAGDVVILNPPAAQFGPGGPGGGFGG